jgi:LysM repeat protein
MSLYYRGKANMQTHRKQRIWEYVRQHRVMSMVAGHLIVLSVLGVVLVNSAFGSTLLGAFAKAACSTGDATYRVVSGDTLGTIAGRYHTTWQRLASYNHLANPNLIYIDQHICIPGAAQGQAPARPLTFVRGVGNFFPYGQCTWWAAQRFYQLHGVYVPWIANADAWEWAARAYQYHWQVSSQPSPGAIINLQPWVQGAYGLGHVAVVERVLSNGDVIASNMNWGLYWWEVTDVEFSPGPGVSFITM